MATDSSKPKSALEDELSLRWSFLEEEAHPCIVVTGDMEFVYLNEPGRQLISKEWFGKRCFELLPVQNESCAWGCPTIRAVNETNEIKYSEEFLLSTKSEPITLGVAIVPLEGVSGDGAAAMLLLEEKDIVADDATFQNALLGEAERLRERIHSLFH
ncbi:MAG: hypothetical protein OEU36_04395 [Gammaproteobacteria bacterium]|nr:hypothetical protein [Gammaproteobacteria bacterium]